MWASLDWENTRLGYGSERPYCPTWWEKTLQGKASKVWGKLDLQILGSNAWLSGESVKVNLPPISVNPWCQAPAEASMG